MRAFAEGRLSDYLDGRLVALKKEVNAEQRNRLLNVNEDKYVEYLVAKYAVQQLEIDWENPSVTDRETMVPAERFPPNFFVDPGTSYKRQSITYHYPVTGDTELLRLAPSRRLLWSAEVEDSESEIRFSLINFQDDPEEIKRSAGELVRNLREQHENTRADLERFNRGLGPAAWEALRTRKQQLLDQLGLLEKLGVSVKAATSVPSTFVVPAARLRPAIVKPSAPNTAYAPEPTLDDHTYGEILRILLETGREMERHPAVYGDRDEETLRDHFIMVLSPHFQSVTGETFNRGGKTDVLIRHEGRNLFVAECKIWRGAKGHADATTQTLGYLTWRDSKAALLYIVKARELQPVLDQIREASPQHPCFVASRGEPDQGRFDYSFHLPDDATRPVRLAVLCFHLPPTKHGT